MSVAGRRSSGGYARFVATASAARVAFDDLTHESFIHRGFTARYALQNTPPRARRVVCARDGAGNLRSRCAFTSRNFRSTDIRSTAIQFHSGFDFQKNILTHHHIALSANVSFRLTLPRTIYLSVLYFKSNDQTPTRQGQSKTYISAQRDMMDWKGVSFGI